MAAKVQDDTLREQQQLQFLFAVNDGRMSKITNIYADETPIKIHTVDFAYTLGGIDQPRILGFDSVGADLISHGELTYNTPMILSYNAEVDYVIIQISFPDGLYVHTQDNSLKKTYMKIDFFTSDSASGAFGPKIMGIFPYTFQLYGKVTGAYLHTMRVMRPSTIGTNDTWRIKLIRFTEPASSGGNGDLYYKNTTTIASQAYQDTDETTYPGTSLVAVRIEDSSQFNNQIPNFIFEGEGMMIKVPNSSYYNPDTRVRTGTWDGTFAPGLHYSPNLAWILYNLRGTALDKYIPTEYFSRYSFTSITRSGSVATVTCGNHRRQVGEVIYISGSPIPEYNGLKTVTGVASGSFTFNVSGTPANTTSSFIRLRETTFMQVGVGIPESQLAKYTYEAFAKECDTLVFSYEKVSVTTVPVSITRVSTTATVFCKNHFLSHGNTVKIIGADQDEYNIAASITYIDDDRFSYLVAGSPTTPATGKIQVFRRFQERKYEVNGQFIEIKDSDSFLADFLTIGNAQFTQINGLDSIIWDRRWTETEINNSPIFTNQNVVDGVFEYSGSYISEFSTQVNVTIQDKADFNKTKTVIAESYDLVDFLNRANILPEGETFYTVGNLPKNYFVSKYGLNIKDVVLGGVTSDTLAHRKAKTVMWDTLMNNLIVAFNTLAEGGMLYKGQVIRIADADIYNTQASGRIISYTSSGGLLTLQLDRPISLSGITEISFYVKDHVTIDTNLNDATDLSVFPPIKFILNETSGLLSTVTVDTTSIPIDDSIFVIQYPGLLQTYTVVSSSLEDGRYTTTCIKYDLSKYDFIDEDFLPPDARHIRITQLANNPVVITDSDITIKNRDTFGATALINLQWQHDNTLLAKNGNNVYYVIRWEVDTGQEGNFTSYTKNTDFVFHIPTDETELVFTFSITVKSDKALPSFPIVINKTYLVQNDPLTHAVGMIEG